MVAEVIIGVIALLIAYLLGSIPSAYIIARLAMGKDMSRFGGGNIGARDVFQEIGLWASIIVSISDVSKGIAAVVVAQFLLGEPQHWVLGMPQLFVLGAGVVAVAGHMWPVYLKFRGGHGLVTMIGVLAMLMTRELLIVLAITILFIFITHNPVLSIDISLLSIPVSTWLLKGSWLSVVFSILLILIVAFHFLPTAKAALAEAGSVENFIGELLRRGKPRYRKR